jgi:hypothetical protein
MSQSNDRSRHDLERLGEVDAAFVEPSRAAGSESEGKGKDS